MEHNGIGGVGVLPEPLHDEIGNDAIKQAVFDKYLDPVTQIGNDAFCELCQKICTPVVRGVIGRSYPEHKKDVVQEASIKAVFHLKDFDGRSSIDTWLKRITRNAAIDHLRRIESHPDVNSQYAVPVDELVGKEETEIGEREVILKDNNFNAKILTDDILSNIRDDDATILTWFYLDDLPIVEIEKKLHISKATVQLRLFRARKRALTYAHSKNLSV